MSKSWSKSKYAPLRTGCITGKKRSSSWRGWSGGSASQVRYIDPEDVTIPEPKKTVAPISLFPSLSVVAEEKQLRKDAAAKWLASKSK